MPTWDVRLSWRGKPMRCEEMKKDRLRRGTLFLKFDCGPPPSVSTASQVILVLYKLLQRSGLLLSPWSLCSLTHPKSCTERPRLSRREKKKSIILFITFPLSFRKSLRLVAVVRGPSGTPAAFGMHESLVIGCRGWSSQTAGPNIRLWDGQEPRHLWAGRRLSARATHSSHIWAERDGALALMSETTNETNTQKHFWLKLKTLVSFKFSDRVSGDMAKRSNVRFFFHFKFNFRF